MYMRRTFDFSTIENQLTGEAINEDFFDDFSNSIINKDNSRRVVDDNAAIVYSQRMILTLMLHHSSSCRHSIEEFVERIDTIVNNCRAIESASIIKLRLQNQKDKNDERPEFEYGDFPKEKDYLYKYASQGGELNSIYPFICIFFTISYEPVDKIDYRSFVKHWEKMMDTLGNKLPICTAAEIGQTSGDSVFLMLVSEDTNKHLDAHLSAFGTTKPSDYADAYKLLYDDDSVVSEENVALETYKAKFNVRNFVSKIKNHIAMDPTSPMDVTFKTSSWIAENTLLVKLNLEPLKFDVIDVKFLYTILRNYFFNLIPDILRKNCAIGVAVTSEAGWYGENNKSAEFGRPPGPITAATGTQISNIARPENVLLYNNGKEYKTNRFVEIEYKKNNARCYVLIPSKNGYLTKNWENLSLKYPDLMKDA